MGRPRGSRNADYEAKREDLAKKVVRSLVTSPSSHASLRELARAADVSVSTMRHYFDDREGIIEAALEQMGTRAVSHLDEAVTDLDGNLHDRLITFTRAIAGAWTSHRVGRAHAIGMAEGLYASTGPSYVNGLLEPFLEATETVLTQIEEDGLAGIDDRRHAALALLSPLFVALMHQESLGGASDRPLDLDAFLEAHIRRFRLGWIDSAA